MITIWIWILRAQLSMCWSVNNITVHDWLNNMIFQIVASLYLVMVVVVVGMNYRMKGRKEGEDNIEETNKGEGRKVIQSSSVSFTERRGTFISIVSPCTKQSRKKVDVWMFSLFLVHFWKSVGITGGRCSGVSGPLSSPLFSIPHSPPSPFVSVTTFSHKKFKWKKS